MIEEAIAYPRAGDDAAKTILIGGVLALLSVLVIPALLLLGYLVRVLRSAEAGEEVPPEFEDWTDLFVDGVKAFVVVFVYSLLPWLVLAVTAGGTIAGLAGPGELQPGAIAGAMLGLAVGGILWLLAFYVIPAALASFAEQDRIGAAFSTSVLGDVLTDSRYAVGWLLALVLFVAGGVVVGLLNVVPLLGFVVGAFVNFYVGVAAFYLYGQAFAEATTPGAPPESASQPAV